jgi:hypothetical protein
MGKNKWDVAYLLMIGAILVGTLVYIQKTIDFSSTVVLYCSLEDSSCIEVN